MDKIKKLTFYFVILFTGCTSINKFDSAGYDLKIEPGNYTTIDFNTGILQIKYGLLNYVDTIKFTHLERKAIIDAFYKTTMENITGDLSYLSRDTTRLTPHTYFFRITLLVNNKEKNKIHIERDYNSKPGARKDNFYYFIQFRDTFMKVLKRKEQFRRSQESLNDYVERHPGLFFLD